MASPQTLETTLESSAPAKAFLHLMRRAVMRRKVAKILHRLQDADIRVDAPEPIRMDWDVRDLTKKIDQIWPL